MHAKRMDKIATGVLYAISGIIVAILASLILYILVRGLPHVSWHFLTGKSSSYQAGGGIGIQLYNSFFLLVITLVISFPLSLGAGIYLSEYAKKGRLTNLVRTCIEILSSLSICRCRSLWLPGLRCPVQIWIFDHFRGLGLDRL